METAPGAPHVESDLADLAEVEIAALRRLPPSVRSARLLEEVRRARSNALGGTNPGRAE
ncbi:aldo/keto reductase [Streptomyces sp. YIM 98790]|uniref:aldo/keto reductase n=1 Tax=Streptomyces sp. YIM 98790 TaxID=2689077 RepID=UPI00140A37FC|nr:aldo/keto reductase [Streptomyces sp. YIM 98790]